MQRNTIRFAGTIPARQLTLIAQGTMWPVAVEIDGEQWQRGEVTDDTKPGETVRYYRLVRARSVG